MKKYLIDLQSETFQNMTRDVNTCMDEWVDESMEGWMDGWTEGWKEVVASRPKRYGDVV